MSCENSAPKLLIRKNPKVSVCVITYNHEKYISQCLQSIIEQETDFDFEIIVGDDCSIDKTKEIIVEIQEKHPEIVKPLFHVRNVGGIQNLVSVCNQAKGDYIAHCDGDDYWLKDKLQIQIDYLENNSDVAAVFTNALRGSRPINSDKDIVLDFPNALGTIFTRSPFVRSSLVERKFNLETLNTYFTQSNEIYDFEIYYLNYSNKKIAVLGRPYIIYNVHSDGTSKKKTIFADYEEAISRLKNACLSNEINQMMMFDLKLAKYLKDYNKKNKVTVFEYIRAGRRNLYEILKLLLPRCIAIPLKKYTLPY